MGRVRGGISGTFNDYRDKIMESRMKVSGAFSSEGEENIGALSPRDLSATKKIEKKVENHSKMIKKSY